MQDHSLGDTPGTEQEAPARSRVVQDGSTRPDRGTYPLDDHI
jgi:hypothetical protein